MSRPRSIRTSLFVSLLAVILVLSGAILTLTVLGNRTAVRTLSRSLIARAIEEVEARLDGFFDPVADELQLARSWGAAGLLDLEDPVALDQMLEPIIENHRQLSSLLVADGEGREHMLLRTPVGWTSRRTRIENGSLVSRYWTWSTGRREAAILEKSLTNYDPRTRPWYRDLIRKRANGRLREGEIHWTPPYTFFTTQQPGITASIPFERGDGIDHVVGFDVLLREISNFTRALEVSENGLVFVLTDDLRFIGLPGKNLWSDEAIRTADLLKRPEEIDLPLARDFNNALTAAAISAEPQRFSSDGVAWWGSAVPYELAPDRQLWIAVIVPEADLLGNLTELRIWIILVTLLVLGGALVRAVLLSAHFSAPIESLVQQSDRMSRGDLGAGRPVVSNVTEVRRLTDAHERMRQGLRSLMKLERDLQLAREIQQSTFPRELPVLRGFDLAVWSEPADETGGDSYDVIGYSAGAIVDSGDRIAAATVPANRAVLLLADATGHGIGPALSVTQIRAMLRMAVRMRGDLGSIARNMNEQLLADLPDERFITAWLAELNVDDHTIRSFSAGQGPLLHFDAASSEMNVMSADTPPFGILAELEVDINRPIPLGPGDIFAVISDGFFEAANAAGELFGIERVTALIVDSREDSAEKILFRLREAVVEFTRGAPPDDDRTAIILKRENSRR